ncbi:MAG: hypothetical protein M3Z74_08240, partial [Pseudomonadota bacterium]|nr:hypothetical protein [Pseudomonadota bacterium]
DYIMTSATDITEERARTDELELASKVFETTADAIETGRKRSRSSRMRTWPCTKAKQAGRNQFRFFSEPDLSTLV